MKKKIKITSFIITALICTQPTLSQADFTIIGLPDTQYYTENSQGSGSGKGSGDIATFISQTNWIVANRSTENIVYVTHLGDCVENGDNVEQEWRNAESAMSKLEDPATTTLTYGIPYGIAVGNHDQTGFGDPGIGSSTTQLYNQYFGVSRFSTRTYYGGHFRADNDNHFDLFSVGTLDFIVVYIEYGAYRDDQPAVDWADSILGAYSDRYAILVSHKLLDDNAGPNNTFSSAGSYYYDKVKDNANLFLMLCGHYTHESSRVDTRSGGLTDVVTLMADFQGLENGGDGWLRIMKFSPADNKIYVKTYSPTLDQYRTGSDSQFELNYSFPDLALPVELSYFTGTFNEDRIELRWQTETEVNNHGFSIERKKENSDWETIGFVEGNGNTNSPKNYFFKDTNVRSSTHYYYRLKQLDNDGTFEYSDVISVDVISPNVFELSQNYPNPFNPVTNIDFIIPENQLVILRIYNTLGQLVKELVNEQLETGKHSISFDASELPSGTYVYSLITQQKILTKKMTLLK